MSKFGSIMVGRATVPQLICSLGLIVGIFAFFLPWGTNQYSFSGLDMVLGNATGMDGFQIYLPLVILIISVVFLCMVARLIIKSMNALIMAYVFLLVGFIILGLAVLFGVWQPESDFKMILNGGPGLYAIMASGTVIILSGILDL